MKPAIFAVLMMVATGAWAEWMNYAETDEVAFYIDLATVRKDGNRRRVWALHDLKQRGPRGDSSIRLLFEYDCKDRLNRILARITYSGKMLTGTALDVDHKISEWNQIAPRTIFEAALEMLCK
ncbi:MAG: hypothetical protein HY017_00350 [Betaproteobacteria bacterium]|nr:hypothetical protein [Betaproteobacteria bacterium]